jgi:hypothetical protein
VQRFKSLHNSYSDAIRNGETLRADLLRNQIHEEQLRFQLEVLVATADSGLNLTRELSDKIQARFAGGAYFDDPIPQDAKVQKLADEGTRLTRFTEAQAVKLPTVEETKTPGTLVRVSGRCHLVQAGATSNDRSVIALEPDAQPEQKGSGKSIVWFEWGWGSQLAQLCQPTGDLMAIGFLVGDQEGTKVIRGAVIPGRKQAPFRYNDPHGGEKELRKEPAR